ncbi:MAG: hypothetical protein WCX08_05130 [Candidatus Buchananbacteria bacterium]
MPTKIQTPKEKKLLRIEVLEQMIALVTSGFGLVAAWPGMKRLKRFSPNFFRNRPVM